MLQMRDSFIIYDGRCEKHEDSRHLLFTGCGPDELRVLVSRWPVLYESARPAFKGWTQRILELAAFQIFATVPQICLEHVRVSN